MSSAPLYILGIESSCDDTAAAVLARQADGRLRVLSNVVSSQLKHAEYGGVVPELASRLHQQWIVPVVAQALADAQIDRQQLGAVAFTQGPGLLGALLVGASFAKGLALALDVPLLAVNHLQGHVASLFLADPQPQFPFLCLTVSGGHTQLDRVDGPLSYTCLGTTRDDAAGEAFDKAAKLLGLPYPGGPAIDRLAESGDPAHHTFPALKLQGYEFSFSGVKTHLLYHLRAATAQDPDYLARHQADLCASLRQWVVQTLLGRFWAAAEADGIHQLAIVGGVSANRLLRREFEAGCAARGIRGFIPPFEFCTDNAAMIARSGLFQLDAGLLANHYAEAFPTGSHAPID